MNYAALRFPGYPRFDRGCVYETTEQLHENIKEMVGESIEEISEDKVIEVKLVIDKEFCDGDMIRYNATVRHKVDDYDVIMSTTVKVSSFKISEFEYVDKWLLQ